MSRLLQLSGHVLREIAWVPARRIVLTAAAVATAATVPPDVMMRSHAGLPPQRDPR